MLREARKTKTTKTKHAATVVWRSSAGFDVERVHQKLATQLLQGLRKLPRPALERGYVKQRAHIGARFAEVKRSIRFRASVVAASTFDPATTSSRSQHPLLDLCPEATTRHARQGTAPDPRFYICSKPWLVMTASQSICEPDFCHGRCLV
jgi:hypothetical protein